MSIYGRGSDKAIREIARSVEVFPEGLIRVLVVRNVILIGRDAEGVDFLLVDGGLFAGEEGVLDLLTDGDAVLEGGTVLDDRPR